jgi:hypothetical protein
MPPLQPLRSPVSRPRFWDEEKQARLARGESVRPEFFRWSLDNPGARQVMQVQQARMAALNLAYDNDGLFDFGWPDEDGPAFLARLVDQYADAGARFLAFGVGSCFAWTYTPQVMECPWASDPEFAHLSWAQLRAYRQAGSDPLSHVLAQARVRNLPIHANFRFNRYHPKARPALTSQWFQHHPEYWLSQESCPFVQATQYAWPQQWSINLAIAEVQERLVAELLDVVERYPVDMLQLELQRAVPFFELNEPAKEEHFTAFTRLLRQGLDRIGTAQGRRVGLAYWLPGEAPMRLLRWYWPDRFFGDRVWGLDPATWAQEGLVDLLIVDAYNGDDSLSMAGPAAVPAWVAAARNRGTRVYGTCGNCAWSDPAARTQERYARAAQSILQVHQEYDGVFLFNTQPVDVADLLNAGGV